MKNYLTYPCIFLFICMTPFRMKAQHVIVQTIRGTVYEKFTGLTLPGANIVLLDSDPVRGTTSDAEGRFRLEKVPVGRVGIRLSYIGFNDVVLTGLVLTSGKELILDVRMEESVVEQEEVVVRANRDKASPINEMATVSARGFTVEETQRYAGSRNDVARMASNFAGVRGVDDSRNDIIIRGNSPSGLLWRLEGVDIPNPNHWAALGTTGGPVSLLNNNQLDNSDFMTGAFPAEYGNASSGVFDLKLRKGNDEKHEFLGQIGFNGFELGAEGPLSKQSGASYIFNYRYSTLEVFDLLGVEFGTGTAIPKYWDGSFKVSLPKTRLGSFSFFGLGGVSDISFLESEKDTTEEKINYYSGEGFDLVNGSDLGVAGLNHTFMINRSTYTHLTLAAVYHNFSTRLDSLVPHSHDILPYYRNDFTENHFQGTFFINRKIGVRHNLKGGLEVTGMQFSLADSVYRDEDLRFDVIRNYDGSSMLIQPYVQWQYRFSDEITLNTGLHYIHFTLNGTSAIEPRIGFRWNISPVQALSLGYGYHSQLIPITVYFAQVRIGGNAYGLPNKDLDLLHSHHLVVGYDRALSEKVRLKSEAYYQIIPNAAVDGSESNSFSILNQGANFGIFTPDSLADRGKGHNYGLELTLEKFLSRGMYYLFTASLYDSRYSGSDGIERNTAFNGKYIFNGLFGKEFNLRPGKKMKSTTILAIDLKTTWAGGQRYTPIAAIQTGPHEYVADYPDDKAYSKKFRDYFRTDLRISLWKNSRKHSMEWALDVQNLFNTKNVFGQQFNSKTGEVSETNQLGLLVVPQFKVVF
jgi:hypothetical protein